MHALYNIAMAEVESMNPYVTAEEAAHWMEVSRYGDPEYRQMRIDQFNEDPGSSTHMFVAMLLIEQCALTPQNLDDVYFAVRDYAEMVTAQKLYAKRTTGQLYRQASIARGEVIRELPDYL